MKYHSRFRVHVPVEMVAGFHNHSASMAAITPPPIIVQVHQAPEQLVEGDEMDFTLWVGPLPVHWVARFEDVTATSFVDRQVRGPMRLWRHHHRFVAVDEHTTDVVDEVEVAIRPHPLWGPVGLGMALNLPVLFAYRAWRTRRLLEQAHRSGNGLASLEPANQGPAVALSIAGTGLLLALGAAGIAGLLFRKRSSQS
jgi:ligand-binding SRPBCC domain-containing protein